MSTLSLRCREVAKTADFDHSIHSNTPRTASATPSPRTMNLMYLTETYEDPQVLPLDIRARYEFIMNTPATLAA